MRPARPSIQSLLYETGHWPSGRFEKTPIYWGLNEKEIGEQMLQDTRKSNTRANLAVDFRKKGNKREFQGRKLYFCNNIFM